MLPFDVVRRGFIRAGEWNGRFDVSYATLWESSKLSNVVTLRARLAELKLILD